MRLRNVRLSRIRNISPLLLASSFGVLSGCSAAGTERPSCSYTMLPPEPLDLSGAALLSPVAAVAASGGDVLIAGSPTFTLVDAGGQRRPPGDSTIGVIHRANGSLAFVPPPLGMAARDIAGVRVVSATGGVGWEVVFAREDSARTSQAELELWHGRLSPDLEWSGLQSHTLGGVVGAEPRLASGLVSAGSELSFALQAKDEGFPSELLIVSIRDTSWDVSRLPPVAYSTLAYDAEGGVVGLFVQPDTAAPQDENSLFVYEREAGEWLPTRKIHSGLGDPAHRPDLLFMNGYIGAWLTGLSPGNTGRANLLVHLGDPGRSHRYILSESAMGISVFAWGPDAYALVQERAIPHLPGHLALFTVSRDTRPTPAATEPDPFMMLPLIAAVSPTELLLVGLSRKSTGDGSAPPLPYINTVRVTRSCPSRTAESNPRR